MNRVKAFVQKIWTYDLVHTAVYSIVLELIVECLNRRGIMGLAFPFMHPIIFIYNTLIIMTSMTLALFFKRRMFVYSVVSAFWIGLALTNFIILSSRKTPFTAMDFYLIKDAIKVAGLYVSVIQIILIALLVIAVIAGLVFLWRKAPKLEVTIKKTKFVAYAAVQMILVFLAAYGMGITLLFTGAVEGHFGNLAQAYKKYGFSHCFVSSVLDRGIKKSGDYSEEYMDSLKKDLDNVDVEASEKTPNIIFVQLESFFDPTHVKGITLSENPLPNYQKLISQCSSGYLSVPCFGAGTCNTEFEVQTGINIDDFGPGEYPYRTIMKSKVCESMAYDLKKLGYSTHAIHNNDGTFYDRNLVFSHLGYETFTSIEYMDGFEETPMGWAKDNILTGEITKALDSTTGTDYVFTISVQGHGDYPSTPMEGYTPEIKVTNFPVAEQQASFEYYVNQIHEMDNFIGELIQSLSERDEETVLVLYGDHLPTFDFTDEMLTNGDKFQTQYVIWSNFDMDRQEKNIQAYQLSAYVMQRLGISEGYIMKYHQSKQELPEDEYLKNLKILEYDILYGKKEIYGGETPYEATGNIDYGLTNDYMFRAILQKSRKTLIGLASALLHLNPEDIKDIEITNPIILGESINAKTFILDVNILLNNSRMLNLEMQVNNLHNWENRSLCYLCSDFSQLNKGDAYEDIKPVINIGILDYTLFEDAPEFYAEFELLNKKTHRRYSDKLGISVLDLTQIDMASDEDKAYGIDTWATVFKAKTWEELRMAVQSNEYMKDAAETLYELNSDETIRQQCEARRRAEIEEKHMQDKLKKLEEDKENLTREKTELHIKLQNEISETEKWKAKYEQLLAAQTEKKN